MSRGGAAGRPFGVGTFRYTSGEAQELSMDAGSSPAAGNPEDPTSTIQLSGIALGARIGPYVLVLVGGITVSMIEAHRAQRRFAQVRSWRIPSCFSSTTR